jgi:hypothetical protein
VAEASQSLLILLHPDNTQLREVVVTGYESRRPLQETAGAIGVLSYSQAVRNMIMAEKRYVIIRGDFRILTSPHLPL